MDQNEHNTLDEVARQVHETREMVGTLTSRVDVIDTFRKNVMAVGTVLLLLGSGVAFFLLRLIGRWDEAAQNVINHQLENRVFQAKVEPFLLEGPRYTHDDAKLQTENLEHRIKEWAAARFEPKSN